MFPSDVSDWVDQLEALRREVEPQIGKLPPKAQRLAADSLNLQDQQLTPRVLEIVVEGSRGQSQVTVTGYREWVAWARNQVDTLRAVRDKLAAS